MIPARPVVRPEIVLAPRNGVPKLMRARTRRLTSYAAALGLAAGVLTVTAGTASAAPLEAPRLVTGYGYDSGYSLEWDRPADDNDLTGYSASIYLASDTNLTTPLQPAVAVAPGGPDNDDYLYADFDNLTPGTRYVGAVIAKYVGGDSIAVKGTPDYAVRPVGKVTSLKVKPGKKALSVSFKAPATSVSTGSIDFYVVLANRGFPTFLEPSQRSVKLTGLTNGKRYNVEVYAFTSAGPGAIAAAAATPIGSPAKPSKFKRSWKKGGKAKLTWKKAKSKASAPVAGYYVYVNGKKKATLGKGSTSYTVKGLKKGKKYSFSIKSRNAVGTSSSVKIGSKKRP